MYILSVKGTKEGSEGSPGDASLDIQEDLITQETSSDYHSNPDDNGTQQQLSSLELENRLLKNEVASLNQEMQSIIQRAKSSQDGKHYSMFVRSS